MKSDNPVRWYHVHPLTKLALIWMVIVALLSNIETEIYSTVSWSGQSGTIETVKSYGIPFKFHEEKVISYTNGGSSTDETSWQLMNVICNGLFFLALMCALGALIEYVVRLRIRLHQIHLSTSLAMLMTVGALMLVNTRERRDLKTVDQGWQHYGWPYSAITTEIRFSRRAESGVEVLDLPLVGKPRRWDMSAGMMFADISCALLILIFVAVVLERKYTLAAPEDA